MIPEGRYACEHGDVLVADSGEPFWGNTEAGVRCKFWRTGLSIYRDKNWIASTHDTMVEELISYSQRGAKDFRIKEALEYAKKYLEQTHEAGLYDGDRSFSKILH